MAVAQEGGAKMKLTSLLPAFRNQPKQYALPVARPPDKAEPPATPPLALPDGLRPRLHALRRLHRAVGITQGLAILVGAAVLLLLAQALCDWWLDLPWFARAGFLLGDAALLVTLYRRHLRDALRQRLTLDEAALLVEKKWPQLRQSVIAAVQLAEGRGYSTRGSAQLVSVALEQAGARSMSLKFNDVVSIRLLRRWLLACASCVLIGLAAAIAAWPASVALLERIILLNVPLPTKTIVVPITRDLSMPIGSDVVLRARAEGVIPTHGRITVTYVRQAPQEYPLDAEPGQPGTFSFTLHDVQSEFKYTFTLNDGHGPDFSVTTQTPPSVDTIECRQTFPAYTGLAPRTLQPSDLSLLAGSRLHIHATATHPLSAAKVILQGVSQTIDANLSAGGTQIDADLPIPARDLTGFSLHLVESSGISSVNETVYPITIVQDTPPQVKILEPTDAQETITLRAKPIIAFDAGDDYGLATLVIRCQIVALSVAGQEDSPTPADASSINIPINPPAKGTRYEYQLDVAAHSPGWKEGDTINYWIEATDNNTVTGPGVTKTDHQQFSVISVAAKQAEIFDRLQQKATQINQIYDSQQNLNGQVRETIPRH